MRSKNAIPFLCMMMFASYVAHADEDVTQTDPPKPSPTVVRTSIVAKPIAPVSAAVRYLQAQHPGVTITIKPSNGTVAPRMIMVPADGGLDGFDLSGGYDFDLGGIPYWGDYFTYGGGRR